MTGFEPRISGRIGGDSYTNVPQQLQSISLFLNGPILASFCFFRSFLITISIQIEKSVDGVLGIQTRGRRMVGVDETTELWQPPEFIIV